MSKEKKDIVYRTPRTFLFSTVETIALIVGILLLKDYFVVGLVIFLLSVIPATVYALLLFSRLNLKWACINNLIFPFVIYLIGGILIYNRLTGGYLPKENMLPYFIFMLIYFATSGIVYYFTVVEAKKNPKAWELLNKMSWVEEVYLKIPSLKRKDNLN